MNRTTIIEHCERAGFSLLAKTASKMRFRARIITFSEHLPSDLHLKYGWQEVKGKLKDLQDIDCKKIWYKNATRGGRHRVFISQRF